MYLAFGSCGYTVQKKNTPYLTAPACPLSMQPVGLGTLGPEIMCMQTGVALGLHPVCLCQDTGLTLNVVSGWSLAHYICIELVSTGQSC